MGIMNKHILNPEWGVVVVVVGGGGGVSGAKRTVSEGDHASGCVASKMGGRALVMRMESGPAVPAASYVGAVAGLVSRIFTVASETVDVRWECPLAFPKCATRWGP